MGYRISVAEYQDIADIYCDLAEQCTTALRQFYYDIADNCQKCRYKPMVDFVNQISGFYYGDFQSHLLGQFNAWADSKYSLDNLARSIGAGEEAARVGRNYMDQIGEALRHMFTGDILPEIQMDTSEPEIDNETIQRNTEYINTFLYKAENALGDAESRTESRAAQNDAFFCIIGIVKTTGNSMIESFRSMLSQVQNGDELFTLGGQASIDPAGADTGNPIEGGDGMYWPFDTPFI